MPYATDGLVAYYKGNSGSGTDAVLNDESGNGNHMALTGFTDGWTGDYLRFNGTTSIAKTSATNLTVKCLEICCKLHALPTLYGDLILTMTSAANSNLAIYERNSGTVKGITGNHCSTALANIYSNVLPNLEQLYHIILQFTGTAVEIWVDGVLCGQGGPL
jgi:hypothetical protein